MYFEEQKNQTISSVQFNFFIGSFSDHRKSILECFYMSPKDSSCPCIFQPCSHPNSHLQSPASTNLISVCVKLLLLDILCNQNHITCCVSYVQLLILRMRYSDINPQDSVARSFFLFIAEYYSIVWIFHTIFIHLSIDGHLAYFHFLVIVNNAAVNTHVQFFVWTCVFI